MASLGSASLPWLSHVAHGLAGRFPDGRVSHEPARCRPTAPSRRDRADGAATTSSAFPADQQPGHTGRPCRTLAPEARRAGGCWFCSDNAHDEAQVRPLLPGSPTCAVVVTSPQTAMATLGGKPLLLDVRWSRAGGWPARQDREGRRNRGRAAEQALAVVRSVRGAFRWRFGSPAPGWLLGPDWPVADFAERLADAQRRLGRLGWATLNVRAQLPAGRYPGTCPTSRHAPSACSHCGQG